MKRITLTAFIVSAMTAVAVAQTVITPHPAVPPSAPTVIAPLPVNPPAPAPIPGGNPPPVAGIKTVAVIPNNSVQPQLNQSVQSAFQSGVTVQQHSIPTNAGGNGYSFNPQWATNSPGPKPQPYPTNTLPGGRTNMTGR